jgi:polycomb group RING finger protein 4
MVELLRQLSLENVLLRDLNASLRCPLCGGYFVRPVVLQECQHTFCHTCILNHFQEELECPECGILTHPTEPEKCLLQDEILNQVIKSN